MTQSCFQVWGDKLAEELNTNLPNLELDELTEFLESLEQHRQKCQKLMPIVQDAIDKKQQHSSIEEIGSAALSGLSARSKDLTATQQSKARSPMEMIRNEYKGMKLGDIAAQVLTDKNVPLTTTELSRIIYATDTDDEFARARNSLSAELRAGAKGQCPQWRKLGRYAYASL
jgi:hypothetical protein